MSPKSPFGTVRGTLRANVDKGKEGYRRAKDRDDAVGRATRGLGRGAGKVKESAQEASAKVAESLNKVAGNLSLEEYRREVDAALNEILAVVTTQEHEIEALQIRIRQFDARS